MAPAGGPTEALEEKVRERVGEADTVEVIEGVNVTLVIPEPVAHPELEKERVRVALGVRVTEGVPVEQGEGEREKASEALLDCEGDFEKDREAV